MSTTATGDFGPAPPGVDLSQNQNGYMLGSVLAVAIIGTIAVGMRLLARYKSKDLALAIDDYLVIVGLVFSWGTAISCFITIPHGAGYHIQALTTDGFIFVWKVLFAYVMIYATAVTCTKASIIMFYCRIFRFRWQFAACLFLIIGYWITVVVTICVACRPLNYFWSQYTDPHAKGVCINVPKFFFGNGIAAMLIDMIILGMPLPIIRGLQMPAGQKMAVSGILLLGSFVCVASVVRIIMLDRNTSSLDPTWTMAPVFIWSSVEPFVGIVCACLPTFGPLLRRWWAVVRTGRSGSSGPYLSGSNQPSKPSRPTFSFGSRRVKSISLPSRTTTTAGHNFRCVDEMELINDITGTGSVRTEGSGSGQGHDGINVKQELDVRWTETRV